LGADRRPLAIASVIRSRSQLITHRTIRRRALLGAAIATAAFPGLAFGQGRDPASQEPTDMKVSLTFNGRTMVATLYDNPSTSTLWRRWT
jgi:hypothetical protein